MLISIEHLLRFTYDSFIKESQVEIRVEPPTTIHQTLHAFFLAVGPPAKVARYEDWNQNAVHHFGITDYHDRMEVIVRSLVDTHPRLPVMEDVRDPMPLTGTSGELRDFLDFDDRVVRSKGLEKLSREIRVSHRAPLGEQILAVGKFIHERFRYRPGVTDADSSSEHVLETGEGVCQDFAHLMLGLLRLRGIPARYVSGYLHVERDSDEPSQSHAWVEAFSPNLGWVPYDPTHDCVPGDRHVLVGHGRDYDDVPPNRGVYRGSAKESLEAEVHTDRSERKGVVGLQQEIGHIELPVYRHVTVRVADKATPIQGPAPAEQQQQ